MKKVFLFVLILASFGFSQTAAKIAAKMSDRNIRTAFNGIATDPKTVSSVWTFSDSINVNSLHVDVLDYGALGVSAYIDIDSINVDKFVNNSGLFMQRYDALAYWTASQANAGGVTFNSTSDGTASFTFSDAVNLSTELNQTKVNAASGSANPYDYTGTLGIMNGSDDFTLFDVNMTNADHTGSSNTVQIIDVANITGDVHATENAIQVGTGWDLALLANSAVEINGVITLTNDEYITNVPNGTVEVRTPVLKQSYDGDAYWDATVADGAGVTFNATSDGTAGFTFSDLVTFSAGINAGTSQTISGTTALTVGAGSETVAINSSDWDINATGVMTGIGDLTSNGDAIFSGGDITGAASDKIDIGEAADATITLTRNDAGVVTLTSADDDANAALAVGAGGTGALTLGDAGSTTAITSSDWAIDATGIVTGIGDLTSNGDAVFSGGDITGAANDKIDIGEATDATFTFTRNDAGVVTITSADNDGNADLTVGAGGTGALIVGDVGSTTAISSSDWTIGATGDVTGAGSVTMDGVLSMSQVNSAGAGAVPFVYTGTLGIMNGTDTFQLFDVNITNADHTGGTNVVNVMDIANITGDAHATENALVIGTGWDLALQANSPVEINGSVSGGIKIAPIATGTATATIQNQNVAASTITLPSATTTLPGLTLANTWTGIQTFGNTAHVGKLFGSGASGLATAFDAGATAGNTKAMSFYVKSTSQLATDVLEGLYVNTYHGTDVDQPAPSGEAVRGRVYLTGDQAGAVALAGMHGTLEIASGGTIGGMGAGVRGNIVYPNVAQTGTMYGMMAELYSGGSNTDMTTATVTPLEIAISGTIDATKWANVPAFRIDVPASLVSTSAYILDTDAAGDDCDAKLKINVNGTDYWIMLSSTND